MAAPRKRTGGTKTRKKPAGAQARTRAASPRELTQREAITRRPTLSPRTLERLNSPDAPKIRLSKDRLIPKGE
jgi:hypothetical protein